LQLVCTISAVHVEDIVTKPLMLILNRVYYLQTQAAVARLQTAVETLQKYLDEARHKRLALNERQQLVELLLGLDRLDHELTRNSELLSAELQTHEAIVQRGEDRLAAREEWKKQ
jgi:hypothetical protein